MIDQRSSFASPPTGAARRRKTGSETRSFIQTRSSARPPRGVRRKHPGSGRPRRECCPRPRTARPRTAGTNPEDSEAGGDRPRGATPAPHMAAQGCQWATAHFAAVRTLPERSTFVTEIRAPQRSSQTKPVLPVSRPPRRRRERYRKACSNRSDEGRRTCSAQRPLYSVGRHRASRR